MRVLDERNRAVPFELNAFVLEEARTYRVVPAADAEVHTCRFGPVPLLRGQDGAFELRVGHAVGVTELVIETAQGARSHRIELRPREQKLDVDAWCALVDDLVAWLPGVLVGLSEAAAGGVAREGVAAGLIAAAVAPLVPQFVRAIEAVIRAPRTAEHPRTEDRRMHTVRRVNSETLRWIGRHPSTIVSVRAEAGSVMTNDPWIPARLTDVSLDHSASRAVRWYAEQVGRRLRPIAAALRAAARGQLDTIAGWCEAQASVLESTAERLDQLVARSFLAHLAAEPPGPTALLTLADDPTYARVLRLARRILGAKFSQDRGDEALPVPARASFELYELWCLLAVRRALDAALGDGSWTSGSLRASALLAHDLHELVLRRKLPEGEVMIGYNLTFQSYLSAPKADRVALTGERRPDLVVAWSPAEGSPTWLVLDAKYRVARGSVGEAFESLHIYRDGLRWGSFGGRPRAGLLLVPTVTAECAPWAEPTFRDAHGLALWALRPGMLPDRALGDWLLDTMQVRTRGARTHGYNVNAVPEHQVPG